VLGGKNKLMENSKIILEIVQTRTTKICLLNNNIVLNEEQPSSFTTLDDAIHTAECVNQIRQVGSWGIIVDIRKNKGISKEARDYYALEKTFPERIGIALLIESHFSKILANFFLGFSKPMIPTKLFTSKEEAFIWLTELINTVS
jgi:hypothetical protein